MKKLLAILFACVFALACLAGCSDTGKENGGEEPAKTAKDIYKPIWQGDTMFEESLVVVEEEDGTKVGKLLYEPTEIIRVNDYTLQKEYSASEYKIEGKNLILTENSTMPYLTYEQYYEADISDMPGMQTQTGSEPGKNILFTESAGLVRYHINVTYKHEDTWQGKVPTYQGDKLPNTMNKLKEDKALSLFMTGDSIAAGCTSSSLLNIEPFRPSFGTGFALELEEWFDAEIDFENGAVGGWTSQDGKEEIESQMVEYAPDLAIIAFGMNDGSFNVPNSTFESNIRDIIDVIRTASPDCEFILIATIVANPEWSGVGTQDRYLEALNTIASDTTGCVVMDMTSFTQELFKYKRGMDMLTNNVNHPSDFLQRGYIQQLMTVVCENYH